MDFLSLCIPIGFIGLLALANVWCDVSNMKNSPSTSATQMERLASVD